MSQHQRMHLHRILDNVAPSTAMKYISSGKPFFKIGTALQVDFTSFTEVLWAEILITMSLSRSTSHGSSPCSSVIKALRWLLKSAEVGCLQGYIQFLLECSRTRRCPGTENQHLLCLYGLWCRGSVVCSCPTAQYSCYPTLWMTIVRCIPYNRLRMPARYFISISSPDRWHDTRIFTSQGEVFGANF